MFYRQLPLTFATFSLGLLVGSLAQAADTGQQPAPPEVVVEAVKVESLPVQLEYSARTAGYREVQVRAQVSGILQERTYKEGSQVKQGQVLFRIDPRPYEAALSRAKGALAQAQARYRQTERDLKRIRELQQKGFASESDLDKSISNFEQSKANIEAAKAEVQSRQIDLDYTTVKAPISGITSKEKVSEGSLMVAGDPNASLLTQITQLDPIYVNFAAPDREVSTVRSGLQAGSLVQAKGQRISVEIKFSDGTRYPLEGQVDFTDNLIDRSTGTVSARAVVPNPDQALMPGQFVRVLVKGINKPNAITVPERAISQGVNGTFVYIVDKQNMARVRPVSTAHTAEGRWVVESGISEGDKVIVKGLPKVRPNAPVKVVDQPSSAAQQ